MIVVAVHGAVVNGAAWGGVRDALPAAIGFDAIDLPGHGTRRDEPFTFARALAALDATLARYDGRDVVLAGDSLGGYLALAAAARTPLRLRGVVAGGCTFAILGAGGALAAASGRVQDLAVRIAGERRAEELLARAATRFTSPENAAALVAGGFRLAARSESLFELAKHDTLADVRAIDAPIVFVNGAWDWPLRSGEGRFRAAARAGSLRIVPRHGHGVAFTAPQAFADAILSLLP
jgi:pimeloyl-ACP methyl ester carboxylesterase